MKKIFKRILTGILLLSMSLTTFIGCNGSRGNTTILNVGVVNDGLGYAWAEKVAREFEKKYENVSFEEGKVGVTVDINPQKDEFSMASIEAAISNEVNAEDMYFTNIDLAIRFAKLGYAMNITDLVNEKCYTADGEIADYDPTTKKYSNGTMSIYDKMFDVHKESKYLDKELASFPELKKGYYSLPYEDCLSGFIYDYDLFKERGWLDYDGVDGLPDNEYDFFNLLDRIVAAGMIPFTSANDVTWYMQEGFQDAFFAQYEGYEDASLCYTYDGEYIFNKEDLPQEIVNQIKSEAYFEETEAGYMVQIDEKNAWLLAYQPSKKAYAEFLRRLISGSYFDSSNFYKLTYSYTDAQQTFIMSKLGKENQMRIAMIQDGEWWENEARAWFNYTGGYGKRDFRFFPLPYIEGQKDENARSIGNYSKGTDVFINNKTKKYDLCKLFLQFTRSESSLETFTMETGITQFYKYDLNDEQLKQLTPFGRNVYKIKMTDNSGVNVVTSKVKKEACDFFNGAGDTVMGGMGSWIRNYAGTNNSIIYEDTFTALIKRSGLGGSTLLTAEKYMEGVYSFYTKEKWEAAYNSYNR